MRSRLAVVLSVGLFVAGAAQARQATHAGTGRSEAPHTVGVTVSDLASAGDPDPRQLAAHAWDVDNLPVRGRGTGESTMESLEFTEIEHLDAARPALAHTSIIEMERIAYQHSKAVYAHTSADQAPPFTARE